MLITKKKRLTPRELRRKHGGITETNTTIKDLVNGADKQWKRYNDAAFKDSEFNKKVKKVFGAE